MSLHQAENIQLPFLPQEIRQELNLPENKVLSGLVRNWPTLEDLEKPISPGFLNILAKIRFRRPEFLDLIPPPFIAK